MLRTTSLFVLYLLLPALFAPAAQAGEVTRFWFENKTSERVLIVEQEIKCFDHGLESMFDGQAQDGYYVLEPGQKVIETGQRDRGTFSGCNGSGAGAFYHIYPASEFAYYNIGGSIFGIPHPDAKYLQWFVGQFGWGFKHMVNTVDEKGVAHHFAENEENMSGTDGWTGLSWQIKAISSEVKNYDFFYSLVVDD